MLMIIITIKWNHLQIIIFIYDVYEDKSIDNQVDMLVVLSLVNCDGKRLEFDMSEIGDIDNVGDDGDGGVFGHDRLWPSVNKFFVSDCDDVNACDGGGSGGGNGDDKGDENDVLGAWTGDRLDDWIVVLLFGTLVGNEDWG